MQTMKSSYGKFKGKLVLHKIEAILAKCFICQGYEETGETCKGHVCPLYQFMPYRAPLDKKED